MSAECTGGSASCTAKALAPSAPLEALVDVEAVAGIRDERLGHEGRPQAVLPRDLLDGVLEHHRPVGHADRVAEAEVDLHLGGPVLDVRGLDLDPGDLEGHPQVGHDGLDLRPLLDRVAVDTAVERLPVRRAQVELELGRRHRLVAVPPHALDLPAQDVAAVERDGLVRLDVEGVADAERRAFGPARDRQGREVRLRVHVRVAVRVVHELGREDEAVHVPRHADVGDREAAALEELVRREPLPAGDAPGVGEHALDGVDAVRLDQLAGASDVRFGHVEPPSPQRAPIVPASSNQEAGMATVRVNGVELYYQDVGSGDAVVFVHGVWMSSRCFAPQLEGLADRHRVLALDLRGHGGSEHAQSGHTVAQYARDLRAFLEALELREPVVVGWSMGSLVLWDYVRQFGVDGLRGIVVVDQTPSDYKWPDWPHGGFDFEELRHVMSACQTDRSAFVDEFVPLLFKAEPPAPEHAALDPGGDPAAARHDRERDHLRPDHAGLPRRAIAGDRAGARLHGSRREARAGRGRGVGG